ncbi:hypothetical protein [Mesorhizobium sp. A556]
MAVTPSAAVRTALITKLRDLVASGTLELLSAANQVLAIFTLSASAGTVSGDVWTLTFVASEVLGETVAGDGTTSTKAQIKDGSSTVAIDGLTVGLPASSADIKLINVSISQGQAVEITAATITISGA